MVGDWIAPDVFWLYPTQTKFNPDLNHIYHTEIQLFRLGKRAAYIFPIFFAEILGKKLPLMRTMP